MSYQLLNATQGQGTIVPLSANSTWKYPFLPGEPPNVLRQNFSACIPSNITVASSCCASAGGYFISPNMTNIRQLNSSEVASILNNKYPNRNNSNPGIGGAPTIQDSYRTGDLVNASVTTNVSVTVQNINWCALPFSPVSSTPLGSLTRVGYQSGEYYGNTPESVLKWIQCFNSTVPASEVAAGRAAYVCGVDDVRTGGTIEGYAQYSATTTRSGAEQGAAMKGLAGTAVLLGGLWYLASLVVLL